MRPCQKLREQWWKKDSHVMPGDFCEATVLVAWRFYVALCREKRAKKAVWRVVGTQKAWEGKLVQAGRRASSDKQQVAQPAPSSKSMSSEVASSGAAVLGVATSVSTLSVSSGCDDSSLNSVDDHNAVVCQNAHSGETVGCKRCAAKRLAERAIDEATAAASSRHSRSPPRPHRASAPKVLRDFDGLPPVRVLSIYHLRSQHHNLELDR